MKADSEHFMSRHRPQAEARSHRVAVKECVTDAVVSDNPMNIMAPQAVQQVTGRGEQRGFSVNIASSSRRALHVVRNAHQLQRNATVAHHHDSPCATHSVR
jgi:hypothetical protein